MREKAQRDQEGQVQSQRTWSENLQWWAHNQAFAACLVGEKGHYCPIITAQSPIVTNGESLRVSPDLSMGARPQQALLLAPSPVKLLPCQAPHDASGPAPGPLHHSCQSISPASEAWHEARRAA